MLLFHTYFTQARIKVGGHCTTVDSSSLSPVTCYAMLYVSLEGPEAEPYSGIRGGGASIPARSGKLIRLGQ